MFWSLRIGEEMNPPHMATKTTDDGKLKGEYGKPFPPVI